MHLTSNQFGPAVLPWRRQLALAVLLAAIYIAAYIPGAAGAEFIDYGEVDPDATFNDVLALSYQQAAVTSSYGSSQPELQQGALWLPAAGADISPAPLLIFMHGGCWLNSFDMRHTYAFATALAQAGYAVWSLEYRRTGDAGGAWPGTLDDVMAGIAWRSHLQEYPVALDQFVIMGHSAGGHLALLAGARTPAARAVIGLAAIADIDQYARGEGSCQDAAKAFMGADPDSAPELYATANPAAQQLHNRTYLLEGTLDTIVPLSTSPINGVQSVIAPGAGHFDWVHPGTPAFRQLLVLLEQLFAP